MCPLAEKTHPLFPYGASGQHTCSELLSAACSCSQSRHAYNAIQLLSVVFSTGRQLQPSAPSTSSTVPHRTAMCLCGLSLPLTLPSPDLLLSRVILSHHTTDPQDGSEQRSKWHGWGDVSLLKQDGYEGGQQHAMRVQQPQVSSANSSGSSNNSKQHATRACVRCVLHTLGRPTHAITSLPSLFAHTRAGHPHPRGPQTKAREGKKFVPAPMKEGRNGLFGLLQGTEAGGVDSWIGNSLIDPTKGKRALQPSTDPKRVEDMTQLLAQTAPS